MEIYLIITVYRQKIVLLTFMELMPLKLVLNLVQLLSPLEILFPSNVLSIVQMELMETPQSIHVYKSVTSLLILLIMLIIKQETVRLCVHLELSE